MSTVPVEIERKYLLRQLPDLPEGTAVQHIEQGYVPGDKIHERLRRVRDEDGVRLYRTIKLGRGVERIEVEEQPSPELFDKLWPLTEGARLQKRRYRVTAGDRTWEIDDFDDRDLVLAEIELDSADEVVNFPPWLAPDVVREVTDEAEYVNLNLAR